MFPRLVKAMALLALLARLDGAAALAAPAFTDVTAGSGIDFVHENGADGEYHLHEIMGSGGALLDHDSDGDLDVFLVQCSPRPEVTSRLYRNDGNGRFTDVTRSSGAGVGGLGMGCAVADWDRDGDPDLVVTRVGTNVALRNEGDGTFRNVTAELGLAASGYSSSAAFLDFDRDGWPDLYVVRYVLVPKSAGRCQNAAGQRDYCNPTAYRTTVDLLFHNRNGRFHDVSKAAGLPSVPGYGLALCCHDFDGDGLVDVYVANDQSPATLWINEGDGAFREDALLAGCAFNDDGEAIAGMGTATADLDDDGDLDLLVTNIREELNLFLRNDGGSFVDHGWAWADPGWAQPQTGFGLALFDQDHDGRLDLFIANGSVVDVPSPLAAGSGYRQPNQFLRRDANGRFVDASDELPGAARAAAVSRGVIQGDLDDDGDVDLLVTRNGEPPQLLRNDGATGHWLLVEAIENGSPVLNARVIVEAGGGLWVRESIPQQSYLSSSDPRLHFGLGDAGAVERIEVHWPDGSIEWWGARGADAIVRLRKGSGKTAP